MSVAPLKTTVRLNFTYRFISFQSGNTLHLSYKERHFNAVEEIFAAHFGHCKGFIRTFCKKKIVTFLVSNVCIVTAECRDLIEVLQ